MPKNERKINAGSIRLDGRVFKAGDEDALNDALTPADARRLSAPGGPLSGTWTGNTASSEPVTATNTDPAPTTTRAVAPAPSRPRGRPRTAATTGPGATPPATGGSDGAGETPPAGTQAVGEGGGEGAEPNAAGGEPGAAS